MSNLSNYVLSAAEEAFIEENAQLSTEKLVLKASKLPQTDSRKIALYLNSRQKLFRKVPQWQTFTLVMPPPLAIEQASSQETSLFKQKQWQGGRLADLTGGLGVDSFFFSFSFRQVDYVERQADLFEISQHNLKEVLGRDNISCHHNHASAFLATAPANAFDVIYLDPGRRKEGQKVFLLEDCSPDVVAMQDLLLSRAEQVVIKLSPLIDLLQLRHKLQRLSKITIIAVKNECKEVLAVLGVSHAEGVKIEAVNIEQEATISYGFWAEAETEAAASYCAPNAYLYLPNAAVAKSGGFKSVAASFGLGKLHPSTHIYTAGYLVENFPGRRFRSVQQLTAREVKQTVSEAIVLCRNTPISPAELRKKYKINEGGHQFLICCKGMGDRLLFLLAELC